MKKAAIVILLIFFIIGCSTDKKETFLDSFENFIIKVEQENETLSEQNWIEFDDSLKSYLTKAKELEANLDRRGKDSFNKEIDDYKNRYKELRKSQAINKSLSIKFYLDNSGSTNGYLKRGNFKPVISKILNHFPPNTDIQLSYSNSEVLKFDGTVDEFVENLTPKGIKVGKTGESNLNNIFKSVLKEIDDNTVSIMVGDGIYSIDGTSDIITDLKTKKESTSGKFIEILNHKDNIETVVVKLVANYEGIYYDYKNGTHSFNDDRPYYIWFFGTTKNINKVLNAINIEETEGYKNIAHYYVIDNRKTEYSITNIGRIGRFKTERGIQLKKEINDMEVSERPNSNGKFGFSVAVDLSSLPLDKNYITNTKNYKANSFNIDSITPISEELIAKEINLKDIIKKENFHPTHLIFLSTNKLNYGNVEIDLLNNDFEWIKNSSNTDDTNPDNTTTFGFKYLMKGISEAYSKVNDNKNYLNLIIKIKN